MRNARWNEDMKTSALAAWTQLYKLVGKKRTTLPLVQEVAHLFMSIELARSVYPRVRLVFNTVTIVVAYMSEAWVFLYLRLLCVVRMSSIGTRAYDVCGNGYHLNEDCGLIYVPKRRNNTCICRPRYYENGCGVCSTWRQVLPAPVGDYYWQYIILPISIIVSIVRHFGH